MNRRRKTSFSFVNLTHPDDLKDENTRLHIRSLAMTEVGKSRRKPRTKRERNEIILEFRKPDEMRLGIERLGGQADPFSPYPFDLDESARMLVANIFSPNTNHASQLLGSWLY
ncbi:unnamed protein product [Alternaria alternata]